MEPFAPIRGTSFTKGVKYLKYNSQDINYVHACKKLFSVVMLTFSGLPVVNYPSRDCPVNTLVCIRNRCTNVDINGVNLPSLIGGQNDPIGLTMIRRIKSTLRLILSKIDRLPPSSYETVLQYLPKTKQTFYRKKLSDLHFIEYAVGNSSLFTKTEKIVLDESSSKVYRNANDELASDPRPVTPLTIAYNIAIARFTGPLSKAVFDLRGDGRELPRGVLFAKGLTDVSVFSILKEKWNEIIQLDQDAVAFQLDVSRWDRHIRYALKQLEEQFMIDYFNRDQRLIRLLRIVKRSVGKVKSSIFDLEYNFEGVRMSGSMWTSLMNHVLMTAIMVSFVKMAGITKYQLLDAGDDICVIVGKSQAHKFRANVSNFYRDAGLTLKVESESESFYGIKFCQKRPFDGSMVRDFNRIVSKSCVCPGSFVNNMPTYFRSVFQCEFFLNSNVPVTGYFAKLMFEKAKAEGGAFNKSVFDSFAQEEGKLTVFDADTQIEYRPNRDLYYELTKITPRRQVQIEQSIADAISQISFRVNVSAYPLISTRSSEDWRSVRFDLPIDPDALF